MFKKRLSGLKKRHGRIRKKLAGTPERPRFYVRRSLKHMHVQVIDDNSARTLFAYSTTSKEFDATGANKTAAAEKLGEIVAPRLVEKGIKKIAFDRGGYKYHGRIKALAESLRKAGLEF